MEKIFGGDNRVNRNIPECDSGAVRTKRFLFWWFRLGCWVLIPFGGIFFLAGAAVFCCLTLWPMWRSSAAQTWVELPAEVVSSKLDCPDSSGCGRIAVSYVYRYQGKDYQCDRYDILYSTLYTNENLERMRRAVRSCPVGKRIVCYVNPDDPSQALVDRNLPDSFFTSRLWMSLPFAGFGFLVMAAGVCGLFVLRKLRRTPALR